MTRARQVAVVLTQLLAVGSLGADDVLLQVEHFDGPWRRQTNIRGYLGEGFCTSNANPNVAESRMVGEARLANVGRYVVWVRGYTSPNGRRALQVEIARQRLAVTHKGDERRWSWERAGEVELPAGEVSVTVHDADVGYECADAILITDRKEYDPMQEEMRWSVYGGEIPDAANALRFNIEACCHAASQHAAPATREEWESRRDTLRAKLAESLGLDPLPPRTPLNARVTGRTERERYIIENVVFESRPRFYVTANVYVPKNAKSPAPAVVVGPGHAMKEGKNYAEYQKAEVGLARLGFVVLSYDPIGQGERRLPGFGHNLGYSILLVGQTNEGIITWDTMRAIDYLCSRPEVDPDRIGLTGNSGGGLNSLYAPAIDDRIKVAASFCFVCSYEQWIRYGGNHCICNHLPGIVRDMEEFQAVGLIAPRPFLFGNGTKDPIFPIAGTRETLRRAKAIYELYDCADKVAAVEVDSGHGWNQPLREACYGWMAKWLQGRGDGKPIPEQEYEAEPYDSPDLLCFKGGEMPDGHETLVTLASKMGEKFTGKYGEPPKSRREWRRRSRRMREQLWEVFGGEPSATKVGARDMGSFESEGRTVYKTALTTEPGVEVPALLIWPEAGERPCPVVIFVDEAGKAQVRNSRIADELLDNGVAVLALDPRGLGEGASVADVGGYNPVSSDSVLLGRPILAQQVWDVMQAAKYLSAADGIDSERIGCYGYGAGGLIALFAGALSEDISAAATERTIASYLYAMEDAQPQPKWIFAPSILKAADIPQVAGLVAPRPLLFANPVGFGQRPLSEDVASEELSFARSAYAVENRAGAFAVVVGDEEAVTNRTIEVLTRL
ncbi:MAG: acetylxylan esterase [Armatimonadota bacterium]